MWQPYAPVDAIKKNTSKNTSTHGEKNERYVYERKTDINNFTRLALSDPENTSHNTIVDELFRQEDTVDPFSEDALFSLSENEKFLKDLGL